MYLKSEQKKAVLALCLLVPAPSLGAFSAMVLFPGSLVGGLLFAFSKIWLFGFPVAWRSDLVADVCEISVNLAWLSESCDC